MFACRGPQNQPSALWGSANGPLEASRNPPGAWQGVLAFFTFRLDDGRRAPAHVTCHLLGPHVRTRGIIVEQREWHAMAAAPASLGYPGVCVCLALVLALRAPCSPPVGPSRLSLLRPGTTRLSRLIAVWRRIRGL